MNRLIETSLTLALAAGLAIRLGASVHSPESEPTSSPTSHREPEPRTESRDAMLREVSQAWRRPRVQVTGPSSDEPVERSVLGEKLDRIMLPSVNFSGMTLERAIGTLSAVSVEYDQTAIGPKGVNIVLVGRLERSPAIHLTLRDLSLRRVIEFLCDAADCEYEVLEDAVLVRPRGAPAPLQTQFYPVARPAVLRMTGRLPTVNDANAAPGVSPAEEGQLIREFLQRAGVDFAGEDGSSLAFDGSQLIVTHTSRNLARVRSILSRYHEVRQVEIEAKFMEVQQGALEELGIQWNVANVAGSDARVRGSYTSGGGVNRTLAEAFRNATSSQQITISGEGQPEGGVNLPTPAPTIPGGVMVAAGAAPLATLTGTVGEFDVNAIVRALAQRSGTELLSAPKITVLSGHPATITVAQEMRYPQSYGQIQSQVGTGSISGGGSAGVSITSGTPQDFATRNVGVELRVTPTVEEDGRSVSLDLNPKVTEFEGFVEYGGPSVAISGGTTVTVPPGFYQPIFAVREVTTRVTIWDGATLIMGGLTREEVKKVKDKVPILGSIPIVGRLFRSEGESSQKRNLLIFVTARLVDPAGASQNPRIVAQIREDRLEARSDAESAPAEN